MSSRVLSAYFDDFRKGKKQREELRHFMEEAICKEPMRRGHFMGWLDQAQYEHPIPVTEFLLLRKEIEATLDNDEQTRIARPAEPIKTSPDADTLVAGDEEATIMAPNVHAHMEDATEVSSGSQPSDMARLHDVPTLIGAAPPPEPPPASEEDATMVTSSQAARAMTMPSVAASRPEPSPVRQSSIPRPSPAATSMIPPTWLWAAVVLLVLAGILGYLASRPMVTVIEVDDSEPLTEQGFTQPEPSPQAQTQIQAQTTTELDAEAVNNAEPSSPAAEPATRQFSVSEALAELKQRADAQRLLPLDDPSNAHAMLRYLESQNAGQTTLTEARVYLKDAYLAASKKAQGQGDWDKSQLLLDAAFDVLSATAH